MISLTEAIERAKLKTGTYTAIGRAMGLTPQNFNALKNGHRQWSPERVDQLGELAGLSVEERARLVWETVRKNAGKGLHAIAVGVLVTLSFGASDRAQAAGNGPSTTAKTALMYIMLTNRSATQPICAPGPILGACPPIPISSRRKPRTLRPLRTRPQAPNGAASASSRPMLRKH